MDLTVGKLASEYFTPEIVRAPASQPANPPQPLSSDAVTTKDAKDLELMSQPNHIAVMPQSEKNSEVELEKKSTMSSSQVDTSEPLKTKAMDKEIHQQHSPAKDEIVFVDARNTFEHEEDGVHKLAVEASSTSGNTQASAPMTGRLNTLVTKKVPDKENSHLGPATEAKPDARDLFEHEEEGDHKLKKEASSLRGGASIMGRMKTPVVAVLALIHRMSSPFFGSRPKVSEVHEILNHSFSGVSNHGEKPSVGLKSGNDGKPLVSAKSGNDGKPPVGVKSGNDGKPPVQVKSGNDGKPPVSVTSDNNGKPPVSVTSGSDGRPPVGVKSGSDGRPPVGVKSGNDGKPETKENVEAFEHEKNQLSSERANFEIERNKFESDKRKLDVEKRGLNEKISNLQTSKKTLKDENDTLTDEKKSLKTQRNVIAGLGATTALIGAGGLYYENHQAKQQISNLQNQLAAGAGSPPTMTA